MNWSSLISWTRSVSPTMRIILIIIVALASAVIMFSCTSSRNISVTVDKAEKVDIHVSDSINAVNPFTL